MDTDTVYLVIQQNLRQTDYSNNCNIPPISYLNIEEEVYE